MFPMTNTKATERCYRSTNRLMKKYSGSLLEKHTSKLQWGITSHWSEWPSLKSLQTINAGEGVKRRETSYPAGGNINWGSYRGKQYWYSLNSWNRVIIWSSNLTPGIYVEKMENLIWKDPNFMAALFTIAKTRKLPKCATREKWIKKM